MKGGDPRTQRMFRAAPAASATAPKASPYTDEDHRCAQPGCTRWGAFGFGPPGYGGVLRWACAEHKAAVAAQRGLGRQ